jgi:hypothetical protein
MRAILAGLLRASIGFVCGIGMACILSLYVLVLYLFRGPAPFQAYGTTLLNTVWAYFVGGAAAGVVVGLLHPVTRTAWGAALVGFVAGIPVYWAAMISLDRHATSSGVVAVIIAALCVGAPVGLIWRKQWGQPAPTLGGPP